MQTVQLSAAPRAELRKAVKKLRNAGKIPAVLYGHGVDATPLFVDRKEFVKLREQAGDATLIDLAIGDAEPVKAIVQSVQYHPVSDEVLHVDFHQVRMDEKIQTEIPLEFVGESPAVKNEGGVLVRNHTELKAEAFPGDLVDSIRVDISTLEELNSSIHVKDLAIPENITVLYEPEEVIAVVTPPRTEAELQQLEEKVAEEGEAVAGTGEEAAGGEKSGGAEEAQAEQKEEKGEEQSGRAGGE